jgi:hypothetical protein
MRTGWVVSLPYFLALGFLAGVVGFRMGWRTKNRLALPIVQGGLGWGAVVLAWSFVGPGGAAGTVGAWAVGATLVSVYVFSGRPQETDERVVRAKEYRASMLEWLSTGKGPESAPVATARSHLRELAIYLLAAIATANVLSVVLGAVLLNYMNAYVATLLRAARRPGTVLLLGWNVWSLIRVAAYVALGAAAAGPLMRLAGSPAERSSLERLAIAGGIGVVSDLALKLALSRPAGRVLARAVDLDAARDNRPAPTELTLDLS